MLVVRSNASNRACARSRTRRNRLRPDVNPVTASRQIMQRNSNALLVLVCLGQFMVILDVSIVNVALPSIKHALGFSTNGLQWVLNAYTLTFAGFLLLGGAGCDPFCRPRGVFSWSPPFSGAA